nr:MAG TPA: hypothetical protein [Bacteriophage sp.]
MPLKTALHISKFAQRLMLSSNAVKSHEGRTKGRT